MDLKEVNEQTNGFISLDRYIQDRKTCTTTSVQTIYLSYMFLNSIILLFDCSELLDITRLDKRFATPAITSAKYMYATNTIWFDLSPWCELHTLAWSYFTF